MTLIEFLVVLAFGWVAKSGAKFGVGDLRRRGNRNTSCIAVDEFDSMSCSC